MDKLGNREVIKCMMTYQIFYPYRKGKNKVWSPWKWDTSAVSNKARKANMWPASHPIDVKRGHCSKINFLKF